MARVGGKIGDSGAKKYWYVTDHVGSVRAVTDKDGKKVWSADYLAFGKQFDKSSNSDFEELHSFTGKEFDPDTGLHYYNARWYDVDLGRFISEDPVADPNNPNLYSYTANNPLRFIDPTGLYFSDDWAAQDEADTENTSYFSESQLADMGYTGGSETDTGGTEGSTGEQTKPGSTTPEGPNLDGKNQGRVDTSKPDNKGNYTQTVYDPDGKKASETTFDKDGNITKQTTYNEKGSNTITYNKDGSIRSSTIRDSNNRLQESTRYNYNKDGSLKSSEQRIMNPNGSYTVYGRFYENNQLRYERENKFSNLGNPLSGKLVEYRYTGDNKEYTITTNYNSKGEVVSRVNTDPYNREDHISDWYGSKLAPSWLDLIPGGIRDTITGAARAIDMVGLFMDWFFDPPFITE